MRQTLYDFCCENGKEDLLAEWDTERNTPLTPQTVSYGSKRKLWWHCAKGHSWQAAVYTRTGGAGCPYCAGKGIAYGNDLLSRYPALAAEWDMEKNAPLSPATISSGSHRLVWWRCQKGHSWRAQIKSRREGSGCPVCAGRKILPGENDLATLYPALAREWDAEKNAPLLPSQVSVSSHLPIWWRCEKGHSWRTQIGVRTRGCGCPVCAGRTVLPGENDLASCYPALAAEWDREKNGTLTPQEVRPASNRRVWWRCEKGHSYIAAVAARTAQGGCPYCSGRKVLPGFNDLATIAPAVAAQWHPTLNAPLTPEMVTPGSKRRVWWCCPLGHVWKAVVYSRTGDRGCGCPVCAGKVSEARRMRYEQILEKGVKEH